MESKLKSNVILCVLNRMFPVKNDDGSYSLPKEEGYYSQDQKKTFAGIQANEAPVKSLIQKAHDKGCEISEIIYLCSNKCFDATVPASALEGIKTFDNNTDERISAKSFFVERIAEFCRENNIPLPAFNPVPYIPSRPADSLPTLNEYLDGTYEVSIDITGGRRDAVILQTLAIQLLEMQSSSNTTGDVVYANYEDRQIVSQNSTFGLIDLINAVDSFTSYGRADQLCAFFENKKFVSNETLDLCKKMEAFSDALAVCQVDDIDVSAKAVQKAMSTVDTALNERKKNFELVSDAINALDDPDGWISEWTLDEALDNIREAGLPIDLCTNNLEELREGLEKARLSYTIIRGELLLHSLIPTMQKKFIPETDDNDRLITNAIIWCVNHQMIQQAMCIYREKISECLLHFGFFTPTDYFNNLGPEKQHEIAVDLGTKCSVGNSSKHPYKTLYFFEKPKYGPDYNDYFTINEQKAGQLHTIMAWYKYLHGTRNKIMHVDSTQDSLPYKFSCVYLGKEIGGRIDIHQLKSDILTALKCIKEPSPYDQIAWNSAYEKAKTADSSKPASAPKAAYSTKSDDSSGAVASVMELQLLLMKFAGSAREVVFSEFNQWCNQEEKKQLSKEALGLDKTKPFYQGLCDKFGNKFSWRKDGETLYLKFR